MLRHANGWNFISLEGELVSTGRLELMEMARSSFGAAAL